VRILKERAPREEGSELIAPETLPESAGPPPGAVLAGVDEATLRIEKLVAGGEGIGRVDGVPLFVPRSAPGDLLRVRITERHPDYGRAEIAEILEPGPGRRPDPVPELSRAGACDLQHLRDDLQPRLKATAVREALERLGGLQLPEDLEVVTGEPWGYRLRTQLHTEVDPVGGGVRVGYHARGTNEVIPLSRCPILVPELEAVLADLPGFLGKNPPKRIDLTAGDPGGGITIAPVIEGLPQGEVTLTVGDIVYAYDARTFFQGHRGLLPKLVDAVVGPWEGDTAYDLYSGVGLFTLPLARRYKKVVAVESDTTAVRYGRNNARRNKLTNVDLVSKVVESWLPGLPTGADRVVVDPPRAGLTPRVRNTLLDRVPKRLTYVSCHPAALARDLRALKEVYTIEKITLFDLFPQTGHMEAVVQLVAKPLKSDSSAE
jgi:23S rRNA (uracil1939-C5)-methyltransferase